MQQFATEPSVIDRSSFDDAREKDLACWLESLGLEPRYAKALVEKGYDSLLILRDMDPDEVADVTKTMKPGHARQFQRKVEQLKEQIGPFGEIPRRSTAPVQRASQVPSSSLEAPACGKTTKKHTAGNTGCVFGKRCRQFREHGPDGCEFCHEACCVEKVARRPNPKKRQQLRRQSNVNPQATSPAPQFCTAPASLPPGYCAALASLSPSLQQALWGPQFYWPQHQMQMTGSCCTTFQDIPIAVPTQREVEPDRFKTLPGSRELPLLPLRKSNGGVSDASTETPLLSNSGEQEDTFSPDSTKSLGECSPGEYEVDQSNRYLSYTQEYTPLCWPTQCQTTTSTPFAFSLPSRPETPDSPSHLAPQNQKTRTRVPPESPMIVAFPDSPFEHELMTEPFEVDAFMHPGYNVEVKHTFLNVRDEDFGHCGYLRNARSASPEKFRSRGRGQDASILRRLEGLHHRPSIDSTDRETLDSNGDCGGEP